MSGGAATTLVKGIALLVLRGAKTATQQIMQTGIATDIKMTPKIPPTMPPTASPLPIKNIENECKRK